MKPTPRPDRPTLRFRGWRALAIAALASLAALPGAAASCTPTATGGEAGDAQAPMCPTSLAESADAGCSVEGQVCSIAYSCGLAPATARCVCATGVFVCADLMDASFAPSDGAPSCPAAPAAEACPASELEANLAVCTEKGLSCPYKASCDAAAGLDYCECTLGRMPNGQMGFRFDCSRSSACAYEGPPITDDAGTDAHAPGTDAPSGVDAATSDATTDAPPPSDAQGN